MISLVRILCVYTCEISHFLVVFGEAATRDAIMRSGLFDARPHPINEQEKKHQLLSTCKHGLTLNLNGSIFKFKRWSPEDICSNHFRLHYRCRLFLIGLLAHCWTESMVSAILSGHSIIQSIPNTENLPSIFYDRKNGQVNLGVFIVDVLSTHPNFIPKACRLTIVDKVAFQVDQPRPFRTTKIYHVAIHVAAGSTQRLADIQ